MQINYKYTIVVCGAGIAGIATAYYLVKNNNNLKVILVDKNQPMTFTTSKSGENFRDFWPQKCMRDLSIHSINLMKNLREMFGKETFKMSFSGYNFISCNKEEAIFSTNLKENDEASFTEVTDKRFIVNNYSYLSETVEKIVSIKNAGNIDVYAMGSLMLKEAKKKGVKEITSEIVGIAKNNSTFEVFLEQNKSIIADKIVIASGPFINKLAKMIGVEFSIENMLQRKFIIPDPHKIIPRDMPFSIYSDAQYLNWTEEETAFFKKEEKYHGLLNKFPGGLHIKPEGDGIKLGWAFNQISESPKWKSHRSDYFPQVVLKGASRFIPQLAEYENNIPTPLIEYAGYYTRTKENWPLIGPTEVPNAFVVGALSGFGTMTACAAGELCAKYILKETDFPDYARNFHPNRYQDNTILQEIKDSKSDGQL